MPSILPHRKKGIDRNETELIWKDKRKRVRYDVLPFQTVERLGLTGQQRLPNPTEPDGWVNRLIWGDNKLVMGALLEELRGKVNLIYIDPPFATGEDFSMRVPVGEERATAVKQASLLEQRAYADMWGYGLDSYLQFMYDRLVLMRELLAVDGSIYIHLDYRMIHYVKLIADEIFPDGFQNEVVWAYRRWSTQAGRYQAMHDTILFYGHSPKPKFNPVSMAPSESVRRRQERGWDQNVVPIDGRRQPQLLVYDQNKVNQAVAERRLDLSRFGRIVRRPKGKMAASDVWVDIAYINSQAHERVDFPTQKPEPLVERIIQASSDEGDLVADFFCGSGTTLAVAEKLGRRWIGCDLSKWAIHVTRKRMLDIKGVRPFLVQTLAQYPKVHFIGLDAEAQQRRASEYIAFILQLYRAESVEGYQTIHGLKGGRYVHVGAPDAPATEEELRAFATEISSLGGNKAGDALFWEMSPGLREVAETIAAEMDVDLLPRRIPKEVVQVKDPAREQIQFHEMPILEVEVTPVEGRPRTVCVALKDFVTFGELPTEVKEAMTHFADQIDYWAVDFDCRPPGFTNGWQSYRTRRDPSLQTESTYTYERPGSYTVAVKVVDIFGNDTTWVGEVNVGSGYHWNRL